MIDQKLLFENFRSWTSGRNDVEAAILFGSLSRSGIAAGGPDMYSDVDLHVITPCPQKVEQADWAALSPSGSVIHKCSRVTAGGAKKITILYREGEVDLVVLPRKVMRLARFLLRIGMARKLPVVARPLNDLATIMSGGYVFIKGAAAWSGFYSRVVAEMPGFRLLDQRIMEMADISVSDLLWVSKKLYRGELIAAQRVIHRFVLETNIELLHELRMRRGEVSFQQARRVEMLVSEIELDCISINAELSDGALRLQSLKLFNGLQYLMSRLVPEWSVSQDAVSQIMGQLRG